MPKSKKEPIPEHFHTLEEAGEFWDTHDLADYWDQTEEVTMSFRPADKEYYRNMVEDVRTTVSGAMEKWSKSYEECRNCGTTRFKHVARGYCTRCYTLVRKCKQVDRWDLSNPQTLKGYPCYHGPIKLDEPGVFQRIKEEYKSGIKKRLESLKLMEEKLAGSINGIDVEDELQYVASLCHARNENLFYNIATYIDHNFNMKQKKILYGLLNKIVENIPSRSIRIDWSKVFLKTS